MERNGNIAFLAHRVETWNALLDSWFFSHLHKNPKLHWLWIWLAPLYWAVSIISLFTRRGYDVVDEFRFFGTKSQTVLLQNYGWHFLKKLRLRGLIQRRILKTVIAIQEKNEVIGLGALTKDEELTQGGQWIVDKLGKRLTAWITHGDTLTAAGTLKTIDAVMKYCFEPIVFITGPTSKIGRAIVLKLAENQVSVKLFTKSERRFSEIMAEAGKFGKFLTRATSLKDGAECQLWLTGKSNPSGRKLLRAIPKGAVVINFSVPNPLGENRERPRADLLAIEGGLLAYDSRQTDLRFTMRLRPGRTYACHAAAVVHAANGWKFHEVGQVELSQLKIVWEAAQELGFFLPALPEKAAQAAEERSPLWKRLADVSAPIVL